MGWGPLDCIAMRRGTVVVVFGLITAIAAGCGSSVKPRSAPTTTTTVESAETRQWVAAASQGLMGGSDQLPMTPSDATCMARAIVETITVAKLKAAGVTLADLRDPNSNPPASLSRSLPLATKLALGRTLQACGIGRLVGPALASGIADATAKGFKLAPPSVTCVSDAFDSSTYRLLDADLVLDSGSNHPSAADSAELANLFTGCLDWSAIYSTAVKIPFAATESACINRVVRNDPAFKSRLAAAIAGQTSSGSAALLGAPLLTCLTPEHLAQLGKSTRPRSA